MIHRWLRIRSYTIHRNTIIVYKEKSKPVTQISEESAGDEVWRTPVKYNPWYEGNDTLTSTRCDTLSGSND